MSKHRRATNRRRRESRPPRPDAPPVTWRWADVMGEIDDGWRRLALSIVKRAVEDRRRGPAPDLDLFFDSEWFGQLCYFGGWDARQILELMEFALSARVHSSL